MSLRTRLLPKVTEDFAVIDSRFPQKEPRAFRNSEINQYLSRVTNMTAFTMYPMSPAKEAWFDHSYGMSEDEFSDNLEGYLTYYPHNKGKVKLLDQRRRYTIKLAYSFFLAETFVLLPFYEKNNIPFLFVLYPGGSFGLDNASSDAMLVKIFSSRCFRGVIATQPATRDYLRKKRLCPEDKVHYIYGGFVQFNKKDVLARNYYKHDKATLDVCFVGHKYSDKGTDKGYDLFIEVAKELCKQTTDIHFHVVGGFGESDIDVTSIKENIHFYGTKPPAFLRTFYQNMDILLSPNRPYKLYEGNFDGFPIGADAGYCGVARFVTDPLKMNEVLSDGVDVVIIKEEVNDIVKKILLYRDAPGELMTLAQKGQIVTQKVWDIDSHVDKRLKLFSRYVQLNLADNQELINR